MADKMEKNLQEIIERYKDTEGALIPVLQKAQELYGYLPMEVQLQISKELQIPLAEIYGVVSFYSQFSTEPKGRCRISVCLGTACYVKGAQEILQTASNTMISEEKTVSRKPLSRQATSLSRQLLHTNLAMQELSWRE